jgi:alpha-galactosidase
MNPTIQSGARSTSLLPTFHIDLIMLFDPDFNSADTMRTDQDLNGGSGVQTQWPTVQRAIEQYRESILQVYDGGSAILTIYPDMDNLFVGNNGSLSGLTDTQRQTVMSHWIGAGANLIIGSNMTHLDKFGLALLTNERALDIANNFTVNYPMVPTQGNNNPSHGRQGQVWIAGPSGVSNIAVILVANYGHSGNNNLFYPIPKQGWWFYNFTLSDMGLDSDATYAVEDVWNSDADFLVRGDINISGTLQDAEVTFWRVTRRNT